MKTKKYPIKVSSVFIILLISFLVSCESEDDYCAICRDNRDVRPDIRICAGSEKALGREMLIRMWGGWGCAKE